MWYWIWNNMEKNKGINIVLFIICLFLSQQISLLFSYSIVLCTLVMRLVIWHNLCVYMCIYVYIYVCVYIYVHICVYMYIYADVFIHLIASIPIDIHKSVSHISMLFTHWLSREWMVRNRWMWPKIIVLWAVSLFWVLFLFLFSPPK